MARLRTRALWTLMVLFASCPLAGAWAGPPTDQLRDGIDGVFKILRDSELSGEKNASQRRTAIVKASQGIFDFGEMAKRSLGQHWEPRTPAERGEFVRLFTELIQRSYISKVDQQDAGKTIFRGETLDGDHAVVRTTLPLDHGREMPLEYKMHSVAARWQVYDLSIDGISLVGNYRTQFNKVIRMSSYEALVARIKSKAEFSTPSASPSGGKAGR